MLDSHVEGNFIFEFFFSHIQLKNREILEGLFDYVFEKKILRGIIKNSFYKQSIILVLRGNHYIVLSKFSVPRPRTRPVRRTDQSMMG